MAVDIASVVRGQRLATLNRSIAATESHEKRVSNTAVRTQAVLTGAVPGIHADCLDEYLLRDIYMRVLEEYTRKPNHAYHGQAFSPRGLALWKRVAKAWRDSNVEKDTFIRAQFTWFHDKFRRQPEPVQLTTDEAVLRAASVAPQQVRTNNVEANISVGDLFKRCEKQMNDLMRAQKMTREEVYQKLVRPGLAMFPEKFLNADPTWRKVING